MTYEEPVLRHASSERVGSARFTCECGGTIDTENAHDSAEIARGLRWWGVPCSGCGNSYTIELVECEHRWIDLTVLGQAPKEACHYCGTIRDRT